jgi:hypothetical protein
VLEKASSDISTKSLNESLGEELRQGLTALETKQSDAIISE